MCRPYTIYHGSEYNSVTYTVIRMILMCLHCISLYNYTKNIKFIHFALGQFCLDPYVCWTVMNVRVWTRPFDRMYDWRTYALHVYRTQCFWTCTHSYTVAMGTVLYLVHSFVTTYYDYCWTFYAVLLSGRLRCLDQVMDTSTSTELATYLVTC